MLDEFYLSISKAKKTGITILTVKPVEMKRG